MNSNPADNNQGKTPTPSASDQAQSGAAPSQAYITEEQLKAALSEQQNEFVKRTENLYRGVQTLTAQAKQRLESLDQSIKRLQEAGQNIDPAVVKQIKSDIMTEALIETGEREEQPTPTGQGATAGQTEELSPIEKRITEMEGAFGIELLDEDPEVQTIPNLEQVGEAEFFTRVRMALMAKYQRVQSENSQRAVARSPVIGSTGLPSNNPIANVNDRDQLWGLIRKG